MLRRIQRPRQSQPPPEAAWPDYQSPLARSWRQSSAGIWIPGAPNAITGKPWASGGSGAEPRVAGTSAGLGIYTSGKWVQTDLPSASFSALTWTAVICPDAAPSSTGFNAFFQTGQTTFNWNHASTSYQGAFSLYNSGGYPTCKFTGGFTAGKTEVIGGTYDGTTLVVYRAGVFENSQTAANGLSGVPLNSLQLLGGTGGTVAWAGSMPFFLWDTGRAYSAAEMAALHANVWQVFAPRRIWVPVSAGGGAQTVAIGQASETDLAQAFTGTAGAVVAIGQASETDTAQALTAVQAAAIGQAQETDTAQALATAQAQTIGQAQETDTAQALSSTQAATIGQASETDTAQAVTYSAPGAIAQASETDEAQPLQANQVLAIGRAQETDSAQALTYVSGTAIGMALEIDTADAFSAQMALAIGQATETDTAQALTVGSTGGGTGASAADVWDYMLSNGKTAEENVVEIHAMLSLLTTTTIADAVWAKVLP